MGILTYIRSKIRSSPVPLANSEIASLIDEFLSDGEPADPWAWDDFTTVRKKDPHIEQIRREILSIEKEFPANKSGYWCSKEGFIELKRLADRLRNQT